MKQLNLKKRQLSATQNHYLVNKNTTFCSIKYQSIKDDVLIFIYNFIYYYFNTSLVDHDTDRQSFVVNWSLLQPICSHIISSNHNSI